MYFYRKIQDFMKSIFSFGIILISTWVFSQKPNSEYHFKTIYDVEASAVKSQGKTGTCWSFSTSSFLESEIQRITGKSVDISEMYFVRNTYNDKIFNYLYRQGKAQMGEGGLAHDALNAARNYGIVPEFEFRPVMTRDTLNHIGLDILIKKRLDSVIASPEKYTPSEVKEQMNQLLDEKVGKNISEFMYEGKKYTPQSFFKQLKINSNDYITLTSFQFQPFYTSFILPIPDNFANGTYYNIPLDEYTQAINNALAKGYTVALDADVSEDTFSRKYGMAIIPEEDAKKSPDYKENLFKIIYHEPLVSQQQREEEFLKMNTTDDHLMHIVGLVQDNIGNQYYKVKNSWGNYGPNAGYVYMSLQYIRLKSISVTMHKDAFAMKNKR